MSSEPEPENRFNISTPETEPESPDHEPTAETMAEPLPEWSTATEQWGIAWELHQYGLGAVYALLFILIVMTLSKRIKQRRTGGQGHKVPMVVLGLLGIFCFTRSLCLLIDAYHSKKITPVFFVNVLWGIGQPCLIAAYTLVFVVMRNALILKQKFRKWYNTRNIAIATLPYLCFAFGAELALSFAPAFKGLAFTCQVLYILYGSSLTVFYSIISVLLWKKLAVATKNRWISESANRCGNRTRTIFRTCVAAVVGGAAICAMQFYAMTGVYGVFSEARSVSAWPWWAFQTLFRIVEIYMIMVLCYAVNDRSVEAKKGEIAPTSLNSETPVNVPPIKMETYD
ncbi:proline-rich transmembrane protein 4-like [Montipora capricornis]|uniref:proline-rich transmembrane protein 4-like n=1 Tax=Montipora capricornis TaxID=246305 RepID=UPI0035F1034F